jgi:hypothetical protein
VTRPIVCLAFAASLALAASSAGALGAAPSLDQRLLKAGDLAGFKPLPPTTYRDALQWAATEGPGDATAEQHWLERAGFVAGAYEQLATPKLSSRTAISFVVQFRTAAGAQADLAHELARQNAPAAVKASSFRVAGIPGAHGLAEDGSAGKAYDVFFVDGHFSFGVVAFSPSGSRPPTTAQVARAALRLFERIHGAPA